MSKVEKLIAKARKLGRIRDGLVLCENCDTPADNVSLKLGWLGCGACVYGSAAEIDPAEFIAVPEGRAG